MRMWMVAPVTLCRKHLLGEHVETHMFLGAVRRGKNLGGYMRRAQFFPDLLEARHDNLAEELQRRGYKHGSPLLTQAGDHEQLESYCYDEDNPGISPSDQHYKEALRDLRNRCPDCAERQRKHLGIKA